MEGYFQLRFSAGLGGLGNGIRHGRRKDGVGVRRRLGVSWSGWPLKNLQKRLGKGFAIMRGRGEKGYARAEFHGCWSAWRITSVQRVGMIFLNMSGEILQLPVGHLLGDRIFLKNLRSHFCSKSTGDWKLGCPLSTIGKILSYNKLSSERSRAGYTAWAACLEDRPQQLYQWPAKI
jgi:hypothetical protein